MEFVLSVLEDAQCNLNRIISDLKLDNAEWDVVEKRVNEIKKAMDFLTRNSQNAKEESPSTSNNKQMVSALWGALCCDDVKKVGYDATESEWVPVNIERLNAAWEKINKSSALHH